MNPARADQPYKVSTIQYGASDSQVGDLYFPTVARPPVVCLLHGGFWRMPYGRDQFDPVARDLASRGFAVWNLEYRRLGSPGGGWPATLQDVDVGIGRLAELVAEGTDLDLRRVIVVGHSAGGQLALWFGSRLPRTSPFDTSARVRPIAVAGLAPIVDLVRMFSQEVGNGAVAELLGGSPIEQPGRYSIASPIELLPLGVNQLIVHGSVDDALPVESARNYVGLARAKGDTVQFAELPDAGHMDYLDPGSGAHATLCRWLATLSGS